MAQDKTLPSVSFDEFPAASHDDWKAEAVATLKGADFEKRLTTSTYEDITLQPFYTKDSADSLSDPKTFPGFCNFLRGTHAAGYIDNPWEIAQLVCSSSSAEANLRIKEELDKGATAINLRLRQGEVDLSDAAEAKELFKDIDFSETSLNINCGASALKALKTLNEAKSCFGNAKGCVGADPIGTLAADGGLCSTLEELYKEMALAVDYASNRAPGLRTVLVDGNVYANGGADAVTELACCMSTAAAYIEAMTQNGVDVDRAAMSIRFSFSLGANFFMEIAKLRAARIIFAQIVQAFGGSQESQQIEVIAKTSSFTKTVYDPYVNVLRTTAEAFAGVIGGINAMEVSPLDEPHGDSVELSRRIARNIQIMLQNEFNLMQPADPAGGSWYVESLTAQLAQTAWSAFQSIEQDGGIVSQLSSGVIQEKIEGVLKKRFQKLATRSDRAVGSNVYANLLEKRLERDAVSDRKPQCSYVVSVKPILPRRWTEQFEQLRGATEQYTKKTGKTIKVFPANMGPLTQHKARADFSSGFFEVAGFEMLHNDGFDTPKQAADAALSSNADVTVICSTDETYPDIVAPLASAIKAACSDMVVVLAGAPAPELKQSYLDAGVDEFIHVRANCYEILKKIQSARGIQ